MSTNTIVQHLDSVDGVREGLLSKLPFFTRIRRRYLTGDAFKAYNISTVMTWPGAFGTGLAFNKLWAGWVVTHPAITGALVKAWGAVVTATLAVVALLSP